MARVRLLHRSQRHEAGGNGAPAAAEAERPTEVRQPAAEDGGRREPTRLSFGGHFRVLRRAFGRFQHDHMTNIAAALAYYAFLAIPAALLVAVGVFTIVAGPGAVTTVIGKLHGIVPGQASSLLETSLRNATQHKGTGVAVLTIGVLLAIWSVTGAMQNVMWAVNIAYGIDETRGFVKRRVTAAAMVVFGLLGFALAFGVLVLGPHLSTWIGDAVHARSATKTIWYIAEWPLLILGLLFTYAGLMYLAPNVRRRRWRFFSFGSVLAIIAWLVASAAFSYYVSKFGSYNKTWGALAAVVVMLTWLWLSAVALLFGAEVNAETDRARGLPVVESAG